MSLSGTLLSRFENVRRTSALLAEPLTDEDCCAQSMTEASPVKWHLAHTTWFFETFVLERFEPEFQPFHPAFRVLYNSYYNGIGEQHSRAQRGLITRPDMGEIQTYRDNVNSRIETLLLTHSASSSPAGAELERLIELGLQHEQQHQELILTDLQHLFWHNPLRPAYRSELPPEPAVLSPERWQTFRPQLAEIGHAGPEFCFDNELPRHSHFLAPYALASRLVTNTQYLAFIEAGGYEDPALWLSEGWAWLHAGKQAIRYPLYWEQQGRKWFEFTLYGMQPVQEHHAITHLSYYEADAFARWSQARLPTEAEWEYAASQAEHAPGAGPSDPMVPMEQLFDTAWQWTSSSYAPYPGFVPAPGAVGEYNGKFMVNQYVLRGGSCLTPPDHSRVSYRNFFPAYARWQHTGLRLARSV